MEKHGLLAQAGLKAERADDRMPGDIGFSDFTSATNARTAGRNVIIVGGVLSPIGMVFVKKNSPIHSAKDLKGRKLGAGKEALVFLAAIAHKWYGVDLSAGGPAEIELLEKGRVDAVLLESMDAIREAAQDRYRVLIDLSDEYRTRSGGNAPAQIVIVANEVFAKDHADIVQDYLKAYQAAVELTHVHPGVWDEYAASISMDEAKEHTMLAEKMGTNIVETWDATQIAVQNDYLKMISDRLAPPPSN